MPSRATHNFATLVCEARLVTLHNLCTPLHKLRRALLLYRVYNKRIISNKSHINTMQTSGENFLVASRREVFIAVGVFLLAALFFISLSVFATTIGTNMDSTGTLGAATSTPWGDLAVDQVAGKSELRPVFVVGDDGTTTPAIFVSQKGVVAFGSSTPSALFLNVGDVVIGRNGSTNDLFVSGGLGVGDATTTDSNIHVAGRGVFDGGLSVNTDDLLVFNSGYVSVGSTTQWGALTVEQLTGQGELKPIFTVASNGTSSPFMFVSQKGVVSFGSSTPSDLFLNP
ncbi:MAG: hypothetical protein G01um101429_792, partial [Parcubacteria group bacterium Gr01-1014_29]